MKRFLVDVEIVTQYTIEVDAENTEDAYTQAENMDDTDIVNLGELDGVTEITALDAEEIIPED